MIHIHIQNIRIYSISTIGSLNIGKAILCHNQSTHVQAGKDEDAGLLTELSDQQAADAAFTKGKKEGRA